MILPIDPHDGYPEARDPDRIAMVAPAAARWCFDCFYYGILLGVLVASIFWLFVLP